MGNIIYTFSLDNRKHSDMIDLLDNSKNKSKLVREGLNAIDRLESYKDYAEKLEKYIRVLREDNTIIIPSFSSLLAASFEKIENKK
tara:strand:- start:5 stop:262 length:258 start_codon:yes stop_codon:yes gene_type:complete